MTTVRWLATFFLPPLHLAFCTTARRDWPKLARCFQKPRMKITVVWLVRSCVSDLIYLLLVGNKSVGQRDSTCRKRHLYKSLSKQIFSPSFSTTPFSFFLFDSRGRGQCGKLRNHAWFWLKKPHSVFLLQAERLHRESRIFYEFQLFKWLTNKTVTN